MIITYYNPYAICHRHMYELSKLILMAIFVGKTIRIQVGPDVFFFGCCCFEHGSIFTRVLGFLMEKHLWTFMG